jgi:hypothetical protein
LSLNNLYTSISDSKKTEKLTPFIILLLYVYLFRLFILVDISTFPLFLDHLSFRYNVEGPAYLIADVAAYAALIAGLLMFYISRSAFVRCGFYIATFLTLSLHLGYKEVNMYGYGVTEASNLLAEYRFAGDALTAFLPEYLWQLIYSFGVTAFIAVASLLIKRRVSAWLPSAAASVRDFLGELSGGKDGLPGGLQGARRYA